MKKLFSPCILILFFLISKIYSQNDSLLILEFVNKKNPEHIEILKTGKKIKLKMKKGSQHYFCKGKLTAITDTNIVIYHIRFKYDSILDYRFNNHPFGKIILGVAGAGAFIYGVLWTTIATVLIPEYPIFAIFYASIAVTGGIMFYKAVTKNKHPVNRWNSSLKKIKG
ncbi:MAG: hypothetical protein HY063_03545 [Bacteroidetes bacterium]|nr:hypothetical protein [Bacteroidota bacterium]